VSACSGNTPAPRAGSRTARSRCFSPTPRRLGTRRSTGNCTCPGRGPPTRPAVRRGGHPGRNPANQGAGVLPLLLTPPCSPRHPGQTAGRRWTTEENCQASKQLTGLDEHQVRRWTSWYRWTTPAMLATAFLTIAAATEHTHRPAPAGQIPLTRNLAPEGDTPLSRIILFGAGSLLLLKRLSAPGRQARRTRALMSLPGRRVRYLR
jgi:hypothetical protein